MWFVLVLLEFSVLPATVLKKMVKEFAKMRGSLASLLLIHRLS